MQGNPNEHSVIALSRLWQRRGAVVLVLVLCSLVSAAYYTEGTHQKVRLQ